MSCKITSAPQEGALIPNENGNNITTKLYGESNSGIIPLTKDGFGVGIFFTDFNCNWVGLKNKKTGQLLKVNTKNYKNIMLWQNPGEPHFVCIEPWYGMPDSLNTDHIWEHKPGLIFLNSNESFTSDQSIIIE